MKVLSIPDPILKKTSKPIETVDKKLVAFIRDMERTLIEKDDPPGVGLSAPQVGKNIRAFSTLFDHKDPRSLVTYINPVITNASSKMSLGGRGGDPYLEGCLSIPNIYGPVWRHEKVTLEYSLLDEANRKLIPMREKFKGFFARVIQHEFDHLEGILFTERAAQQGLQLYIEKNGELYKMG